MARRDEQENADCRIIVDDPQLRRVVGELRPLLRNGIRLLAGSEVTKPAIGTSRLGGNPDLPDGIDWPVVKIEMPKPTEGFLKCHSYHERLPPDGIVPLPFVTQINLEEVQPFDTDKVLPPTGMLYFFYNPKAYASDTGEKQTAKDMLSGYSYNMYGWNNPGIWRVIFHEDGNSLTRRQLPEQIPESVRYCCRKVSFRSELVLPSFETCYFGKSTDSIQRVEWTESESQAYRHLCYERRANLNLHQLLGYADEYATTSDEGSYERWRTHLFPELPNRDAIEESAWVAELRSIRLLLQLEIFDQKADWYGRNGSLFFFIRDSDLKARKFEKVWAAIE